MIRRKKKIQNEKCTQAILFARVSSKKQKDKGVSLDVQMETITKYCHDKGLKIIKDFSIDESSTKGERKQYHEMLDFAKSCPGKVAIVVNYVDSHHNPLQSFTLSQAIAKILIRCWKNCIVKFYIPHCFSFHK